MLTPSAYQNLESGACYRKQWAIPNIMLFRCIEENIQESARTEEEVKSRTRLVIERKY